MFTFRFGQTLKVHTASAFKDSEGNDKFVIIFTEDENQPEGMERPSRSKNQIKVWGNGVLPEKLHNDCLVQVESCAGFDWKHVPRKNRYTGEVMTDRQGNTLFDSHIELVGPVIHIVEPQENIRKSKKKAEATKEAEG